MHLLHSNRHDGLIGLPADHHIALDPDVVAFRAEMEGKINFGSYEAAAETFYSMRGRRAPVAISVTPVDDKGMGRVRQDAPVTKSQRDTERKVRTALRTSSALTPVLKQQPTAEQQAAVETSPRVPELIQKDVTVAPCEPLDSVREEPEVPETGDAVLRQEEQVAGESIVATTEILTDVHVAEESEEVLPLFPTVKAPISVQRIIGEDQADADDVEPESFSVEAVLHAAAYDERRTLISEESLIMPVAVEAPDVVHEEVEIPVPQLERLEIPPLGLSPEDQRAIGVQLHLLQQAGKMDKAHIRKACEMVFGLHGTDKSLISGVVQSLCEELPLQIVEHIPKVAVAHVPSADLPAPIAPKNTVASSKTLRQLEHELLHGVSSTRVRMHTKVSAALVAPAASKTESIPESLSEAYDVIEEGDASLSDLSDDEFGYGDVVEEEIDFEALGIDPCSPTQAKPGTEEKVLMLAARYEAGVPLWHERDCYEHGHASLETMMAKLGGHPKGS